MAKRILILTAGYGEGHNSAARGVRDGLARVAPDTIVDLRDLFAETFGPFHELVRRSYLTVVNRFPKSWGAVYRWFDRKKDYDKNFARFRRLKKRLAALLNEFQPDVVVSVFPPYPYMLEQIAGANRTFKNIAIVTDSITVNAIWFRSRADYFLLPNEQSADVLRRAGIANDRIKVLGFPVNPVFAELSQDRQSPSEVMPRVLYMINIAARGAIETVRRLLELNIHLTVTVGRSAKLGEAIAKISDKIDIVGWTDQLPRMMRESHLLIGKAGGATTQETIAAGCPMIINHVVSGQEEGNARLIAETNSGAIALTPVEVASQVQRAFANDAQQWREWSTNIARLSRPRAALDIAEFLLSI
ncbi:MAG: processive 1,2-diacylglycerol beta-glucosyltransferase [Verrucomicrobiota bacterium]|jgi:UDP-N-acetylglucosamine:LPS N-acetylglucosamine transferase